MENHFLSVLDKHIPEMKVRARQEDAPYMTKELKMAIRKKFLKEKEICTIVCPKPNLRKLGVKKEMAKFGH